MELIHGGPPALPGSCYKCNSGSRKRYIDLRTQVEFHGAMYLCDLCIIEMAQLLGMETEERVTKLKFSALTLEEENTSLGEEVRVLKKVLHDGLAELHPYLNPEPSAVPGDGDSPVLQGEESQDGEGELGSGEEGSSEPSDDDRLDKLRSTKPKSDSRSSF